MMKERIPTGIPGFDGIMEGGFLPAASYLIVGSAGTGKTILSLQWLLDGVRREKKGLFVTLAEPSETVRRNVENFGWSLEGLKILDLVEGGESGEEEFGEYQVFPPSEVEEVPLWNRILDAVREYHPQRVVLDSATQLRYLSTDEYQFRKHILTLVHRLSREGCTTLFTFEPTELERETSIALAVDGLIRIKTEVSPSRVITLRSLQVEKFRGSDFLSGLHPLRITGEGITVYPHRIEKPCAHPLSKKQLPSGIATLDELLHGGIETETATVLTGPSGAGKTTLTLRFLSEAAAKGEKAMLYTFEEGIESIRARAAAIGHPIDTLLAGDRLHIVQVNPLQLYPDEFLQIIRNAVEKEGHSVVAIDSLRGYQLAMEQFGTIQANLHNLLTYLRSHGATVLLVNEVEHLTGDLMITEIGISYLCDNVLLLRYSEYNGQIIKVISCLKKRLGNFQPELRELKIGREGIQVGEKLSHLRGILTGVPLAECREETPPRP